MKKPSVFFDILTWPSNSRCRRHHIIGVSPKTSPRSIFASHMKFNCFALLFQVIKVQSYNFYFLKCSAKDFSSNRVKILNTFLLIFCLLFIYCPISLIFLHAIFTKGISFLGTSIFNNKYQFFGHFTQLYIFHISPK